MTSGGLTAGRTSDRPRTGDWLFALALLLTFTGGYLAAEAWPFRAALFPQIVSVAGALLTLLKLVGLAFQAARSNSGGRPDQPVHPAVAGVVLVDEEAEEDEGIDYVFSTAGARAWMEALAWIVAFFASLWVLGVFVTVPLFALLYLKSSGKTSWIAAVIYAAVTGGIIYLVFRQLLYLSVPDGLL